ncbi:MAG: UDP-N-acetylmuramate--L-alanine ligase [Phycisphaerales bacterium]|nr:UDP-N-acetylmuramate--L-alanine ligase [Phycisphaerales bacterium]
MSRGARMIGLTGSEIKVAPPLYPAVPSLRDFTRNWLPVGQRVHLIGVGGCGMRGAAEMLLRRGAIVSGSDRAASDATAILASHGAKVYTTQAADHLPESCHLVVYSAAIKETNPELAEARRRGYPVMKYSQLLGLLMAQQTGLAIAGTHGKSTTTAMVAYVLRRAGCDPSYVIGAEVEQLGGGSGYGEGEHFVVEACEYDRSFVNLRPRLAAILNIEEDHLDYYADLDAIEEAFRDFIALLPADGLLVVNGEDRNVQRVLAGSVAPVETFGFEGNFNWRANILDSNNGCIRFEVWRGDRVLTEVAMSIPGRHNASNALAAMALCFRAGVEPETIAKALGEFGGAGRRLTLRGSVAGVTVVDDYAHHPTEIQVTLRAARDFYRPRKMFVVFQPHQHSRTRCLLNDFARSFGSADLVIVPDIFFVRDSESERDLIDSIDLVERIHAQGGEARYEKSFERIVMQLGREVREGDLVITMGAGDVWRMADQLLDCLKQTRSGK